jgi:hypothetical protein
MTFHSVMLLREDWRTLKFFPASGEASVNRDVRKSLKAFGQGVCGRL